MIATMVATANRMDWGGWIRGIVSAVIGGGSGAVSAGFGTVLSDWKDPDHFALQPGHLFETMGICFAFTGFLALMTFLHNHPIPDMEPAMQQAVAKAAVEADKAKVQAAVAADAVADVQNKVQG